MGNDKVTGLSASRWVAAAGQLAGIYIVSAMATLVVFVLFWSFTWLMTEAAKSSSPIVQWCATAMNWLLWLFGWMTIVGGLALIAMLIGHQLYRYRVDGKARRAFEWHKRGILKVNPTMRALAVDPAGGLLIAIIPHEDRPARGLALLATGDGQPEKMLQPAFTHVDFLCEPVDRARRIRRNANYWVMILINLTKLNWLSGPIVTACALRETVWVEEDQEEVEKIAKWFERRFAGNLAADDPAPQSYRVMALDAPCHDPESGKRFNPELVTPADTDSALFWDMIRIVMGFAVIHGTKGCSFRAQTPHMRWGDFAGGIGEGVEIGGAIG
ncbi:MAG: hypothetical protein WA940_04330 [Sphingopyxis sp.]